MTPTPNPLPEEKGLTVAARIAFPEERGGRSPRRLPSLPGKGPGVRPNTGPPIAPRSAGRRGFPHTRE